jgi:hypothetical protein
MTDREIMQKALEALCKEDRISGYDNHGKLRKAISERLAQPEQEPVAWLSTDCIGERYLWFSKPLDNDTAQPLYTAPQQREWQGLTDEESNRLVMEHLGPHALTGGKMSVYDAFLLAIRATEAKLKEKND